MARRDFNIEIAETAAASRNGCMSWKSAYFAKIFAESLV